MAIFEIDNYGTQQMQILETDIDAFIDLVDTGELNTGSKGNRDRFWMKRINDCHGSRRYLVSFQEPGELNPVRRTKRGGVK
jgi:hypothetical protein